MGFFVCFNPSNTGISNVNLFYQSEEVWGEKQAPVSATFVCSIYSLSGNLKASLVVISKTIRCNSKNVRWEFLNVFNL